jgi:hypothetical protein
VINELRLRLPISERESITMAAQKSAGVDDYVSKQSLKVAQATVSSLQVNTQDSSYVIYGHYRFLNDVF